MLTENMDIVQEVQDDLEMTNPLYNKAQGQEQTSSIKSAESFLEGLRDTEDNRTDKDIAMDDQLSKIQQRK